MTDPADDDLLQRLRDGDAAAPDEFCDRYLAALRSDRRWLISGVRDEHTIDEAAIDALFEFVQRPHRYDPAQLTVMGYLRLAARRNLLNAIARERRHATRRAPLEPVELHPPARNDEQEVDLPNDLTVPEVLQRLHDLLPDPHDWAAARLIIDGEKPTMTYARIYGIEHLPVAEQRRLVKQHKDRLDKVMKRLGVRLRERG
jgi:DNA-directed RNA polymerase specialized sigma24 family protein